MKKKTVTLLLLFFLVFPLYGNLRLPHIFGNNMVIQRNREIKIWGWSNENETIEVLFNGMSRKARVTKNGSWEIILPPMDFGGPYSMVVKGRNEEIKLTNILIGDVWICSGQSNMEWVVQSANNAEQEINNSDFPQIRSINIKHRFRAKKDYDISGEWSVCSPETVGMYSAVGYFFIKKLYEVTRIPMGLIHASWGGSEIETWISPESFALLPPEFKTKYVYNSGNTPEVIERKLEDPNEKMPPSFLPNLYPSALYNGMIHPLIKFSIKGIIWYQGENNAERACDYKTLFPHLINDWRDKWNYDFPFYWVQLPNYMPPDSIPTESSWAELREAQSLALRLKNTGQAVIIDIGDANDVHPRNKKEVGNRLARIALKKDYNQDIVYSGPTFKSMKIDGNKVTIDFEHTGSGLITTNKYGYIPGFSIAGPDRKFQWAKAYIKNNKVIVYAESVTNLVAVRYGWANNPDDLCLYNREGLPASPFRTDNWTGITCYK